MKNNYNFGVVKLHLKFNQRTKSTPHKFQTRFPSQNLILFQPDLCLKEGMWLKMEKRIDAKNPTARHNYTIENAYEAGIVLTGTEIKSIRKRKG